MLKNKKDGYCQLNVRQLGSLRPWDNRGKCYTDRRRIQCLSNASQHVPIYLQPFLRYSKLLVENCVIFTPHLCLAAPQGVTPSDFREDQDLYTQNKNEYIVWCKKHEKIFSRFDTVPACDGRTDRLSITCFSIAGARKILLLVSWNI